MLKWLLGHQLLQVLITVLLGLVLFGVSSAERLAAILGLFAASKLLTLAAECFRKPRPLAYWTAKEAHWTSYYQRVAGESPEALADEAEALGLPDEAPPEELVRARMRAAILAEPPLRPKFEVGAEMLGVLGFVLLLPAVLALFTHDFYSLRMRHGWGGAAIVLLAIALYVWPSFWAKSPTLSARRSFWWVLPALPLLLFFVLGIQIQHPYLDPFRADHTKLAADRVLALQDNIFAGAYVDWVMKYARELDQQGERERAAHYYRAALRLDPTDRAARARLAALEPASDSAIRLELPAVARPSPTVPYWSRDQPLPHASRVKVDAALESVDRCTVVLVPVGAVPDHLLDAVAHTIEQELRLPVMVRSSAVPQPPHTRARGLLGGPQWDVNALAQAFLTDAAPVPSGPMRYVLITPADIYINDSNYAFSASYQFGGLVSFARFGQSEPGSLCEHRTAKQSLCALLKSFEIPASLDRDCVTSYTKSLDEFDAKGNRPSAATLALFQRKVGELNEGWRRFKAARASERPAAEEP